MSKASDGYLQVRHGRTRMKKEVGRDQNANVTERIERGDRDKTGRLNSSFWMCRTERLPGFPQWRLCLVDTRTNTYTNRPRPDGAPRPAALHGSSSIAPLARRATRSSHGSEATRVGSGAEQIRDRVPGLRHRQRSATDGGRSELGHDHSRMAPAHTRGTRQAVPRAGQGVHGYGQSR